jgi:hypothetical protein
MQEQRFARAYLLVIALLWEGVERWSATLADRAPGSDGDALLEVLRLELALLKDFVDGVRGAALLRPAHRYKILPLLGEIRAALDELAAADAPEAAARVAATVQDRLLDELLAVTGVNEHDADERRRA